MFSLAILLSFILPGYAYSLNWMITPVLVVAMTFALKDLDLGCFSKKDYYTHAFKAVSFNLILLNLVILVSAFLLVDDLDYLSGFVIMAAVPPAISCVPFTFLLGGDTNTSMLSEIIAYILSLFLAPLLIIVLLSGSVDVFFLIRLLVILILLPLLLSRLCVKIKSACWIYSKSIITVSFALITYLILGLNHGIIISEPVSLIPVMIVIFLRSFVVGTIVFFLALKSSAGRRAVTYALFSSFKNNGAAAVIALSMLSAKASLPMAFAAVAEPLYLVFLQHVIVRRRFD